MDILFYISIILFAGLVSSILIKPLKLPNVTAYLLIGLLLGPSLLNVIPKDISQNMSVASNMALAFIAFSIGSEFKASYFKKVGFTPVVIALTEALGGVLFVTLALILAGFDASLSILLGSIAAATAPAATIMVVRQYKAKGPVTDMLMSVVALDDAVALISFGFAVTIAESLNNVGGSTLYLILLPLYEVGISIIVGGLLGGVFAVIVKSLKKSSNNLTLVIAFVFLTSSLASLIHGSSLLMCMSLGAVFINLSSDAPKFMKLADSVTPPLFLMFFVVSGADLNLSVIPTIGLIGVLYIVFRVLGKILGSWFGSKIMKAPSTVCKYLGPTLIPQAGVAIGLSLVAESVVPQYSATIRAVVLCATFVYEIIGPVMTKISLQKAGEIAPSKKTDSKVLPTVSS